MWRGMTDHLQGQFFMINKKNQMLVLEMFFVIHLTFIFSTLLFPLFIYYNSVSFYIWIIFPELLFFSFKLLDIYKSEQNGIMNPYIYFIYKKKFFVEKVFLYYQDCHFIFWTGGLKVACNLQTLLPVPKSKSNHYWRAPKSARGDQLLSCFTSLQDVWGSSKSGMPRGMPQTWICYKS